MKPLLINIVYKYVVGLKGVIFKIFKVCGNSLASLCHQLVMKESSFIVSRLVELKP